MRVYRFGFIGASLLVAISAVSHAQPLRFSFADAAGDQPSMVPDVVGLVVTFDQAMGDYEVVLTADAASPLAPTSPASLVVYVNLFNPDVGVTTQDPSYFKLFAYLQLSAPTTSLTLTGTNDRLTTWNPGNRVANDSVLGNPDGVGLFSSGVRVIQDRTIIGGDTIAPGGIATVVLVPEPTTYALASLAIFIAFLAVRLTSIRAL